MAYLDVKATADSPFDFAQGNDRQKGEGKARATADPYGMTERKARQGLEAGLLFGEDACYFFRGCAFGFRCGFGGA